MLVRLISLVCLLRRTAAAAAKETQAGACFLNVGWCYNTVGVY